MLKTLSIGIERKSNWMAPYLGLKTGPSTSLWNELVPLRAGEQETLRIGGRAVSVRCAEIGRLSEQGWRYRSL